ncbi:hypothetical protein K493DRAFT_317291 [Basidiobolus meristosporus CBS 931.73]|uniref:Transmembrane protein n=1 Tax=Basidiobolus meristosporus CBS 931.73 TaxID=1314790 RepID=A0A1Y1Y0D4_9FUNG|nr:hypothetical protein K493DRAFT_317291 [Basidiobolus meristosporus CBS 931.73]|eukprot:ORX91428.1 hypothetical protein K493DRAFT_317291 [Basidiobolus meristosporus CBS 931.73]
MPSVGLEQPPPEASGLAFEQFRQAKLFTFIYAAMFTVMIPNFIYATRLILRRGYSTIAPVMCFVQSLCALVLMAIALFSFIYPMSSCLVQGRIIESLVIAVLIGLHSLLFVKAYFAVQKPLWLLVIHVILELAFVTSVLMAAIKETHVRLEVERICLSILPEDWLLVELVLDIVFNLFYSGIFLWVLRIQQKRTKGTHWAALIKDGLIYMFAITLSTTTLVAISIINGPAKTGVLLFAVAAVIGSCLMTSQLWMSTSRSVQVSASFLTDDISKHSNTRGSSSGQGRRHDLYHNMENGHHEAHMLRTVESKTALACNCEASPHSSSCFCQLSS